MSTKKKPFASEKEAEKTEAFEQEPLTDAQRDFARLLGRLLAERWQDEQRICETTDST